MVQRKIGKNQKGFKKPNGTQEGKKGHGKEGGAGA